MQYLYFIPPVFFAIAFVFSMLGMGGSQLYIPILYWLGMDLKTQAIPLGMLLNVVNSSSAAFTYARKSLVQWKIAVPFGITMSAFAPLGAMVNLHLPTKPIVLIFAAFTASAAVLMISGWRPKAGSLSRRSRIMLGFTAGSILGFCAGLLGRGGGSFVVPLLYFAGLEPRLAAATSAVVVSLSGMSSFLSHLTTAARPDWLVWALSGAAILLGSRIGSRIMAEKLNSKSVKLVFGLVLLTVAAILAVKELA